MDVPKVVKTPAIAHSENATCISPRLLGPRNRGVIIAPTVVITDDIEELTVDGVRMVFQNTPGTEAPAEMNTWFPDHKAFWAAENITGTIHNIYTLRGALVRDALEWARQINVALYLFGVLSSTLKSLASVFEHRLASRLKHPSASNVVPQLQPVAGELYTSWPRSSGRWDRLSFGLFGVLYAGVWFAGHGW